MGAMDADACPPHTPASSAHRDMCEARATHAEPERVCGAVMAQERVVTDCEHGRPPPSLAADCRMARGVDATVQLMQPSHVHAPTDLAPRQAKLAQLIERHDAGLTHSEPGYEAIRGELSTHAVLKSPRADFSPPVVGCRA
jgi:hypothetical protein